MLFRWTWPKLSKLRRSSRPGCRSCTRRTNFKVTSQLTKLRRRTSLRKTGRSSELALQSRFPETTLRWRIKLDIRSQSLDNLFSHCHEEVDQLKIEFRQLQKIWERERIPEEKRSSRKSRTLQTRREKKPEAQDLNSTFGEAANKIESKSKLI